MGHLARSFQAAFEALTLRRLYVIVAPERQNSRSGACQGPVIASVRRRPPSDYWAIADFFRVRRLKARNRPYAGSPRAIQEPKGEGAGHVLTGVF